MKINNSSKVRNTVCLCGSTKFDDIVAEAKKVLAHG